MTESPLCRVAFDEPSPLPYAVATMPSQPSTKENVARSPLSGHPVGLHALLALNLLGLLLILAR